jgi:hypothetical protein
MIRHSTQRQKHNQLHFAILNETCAATFIIKIRDKGYGIHGVQNLVVAINIPTMFDDDNAVTGFRNARTRK